MTPIVALVGVVQSDMLGHVQERGRSRGGADQRGGCGAGQAH